MERTQREMGVLKGSAGLGGLELCAFHTDACTHGEREERFLAFFTGRYL